jgi:ubiquinone/menaquinone biosynthesis C-methylase UbiE
MTVQNLDVPSFNFDYENPSIIEGHGIGNPASHDLAATRLIRMLAAFEKLAVGAQVMEVGCGAGRQARTLKNLRPELQVFGCDLSQLAIAEARKYNDGVGYEVSDAARLPYVDARFDAVMLFDVLEHVPDVESVMREVARVLKPGGLFHAYIPIEGQAHTVFSWLRNSRRLPLARWKREQIGHIQQLTDSSVIEVLQKCGLEPQHYDYSFHLAAQLHDLADYWRRDQLANPSLDGWRRKAVIFSTRLIFFPLWRISYWEDKWRAKSNRAAGLHITAVKID